MRLVLLAVVTVIWASPASAQQYWYFKGKRADATPQLVKQITRDRAICEGRAAAAGLGGRRGLVAALMIQQVFDGCMYELGYEKR